jgi:hypothetical protein
MNRKAAWALAISLASWSCSRREPPPPPPGPAPLDVDRQLLEEAMRQCFTVDCDRAHEHAAQISADSALRQSDDFHAIEYHFEVNRLLRAQSEPDFEKQRSMLDLIRNSTDADPGIRTAAAEMLARLGGGRRFELILAGHPDAGLDGGDSSADAGNGDTQRIAALMKSKKAADYVAARALIEPRIFSGSASPDDVRSMTTICKAQKDATCLKMIKTLKLR